MFHGPLFVVGAPRSGTKLLRDLLNRHPMIGIPPYETEFLPRAMAIGIDPGKDWDAFERWATRFMYFKYMDDEGRRIPGEAWKAPTLAEAFERLCRHDGGAPADGIWGDKSPNYRNHLPELAALYPEARFIHLVRDVRDVVLSSKKAWGKDMIRNAQRWADEVAACRRAGQALGPRRYREIRYEDLLARPEASMRQLCEFIEVDFDPSMTEPGRPSENLGDARGERRVVTGNTGKWRTQMTRPTLRRVEAICGPLLEELGYPLSLPRQAPTRVSRLEMMARQVKDGAYLLRFRVKEWGIRDALRYSVSAFESTRV